MKVQIFENYEEMSLEAARIVAAQVRLKPCAHLGLATGSTPIGLYQNLIRMHQEENLDFSQAWALNLDEYVGLEKEDEHSYAYFMRTQLFQHINIPEEQCLIPNSVEGDAEEQAQAYEYFLEAKPRDLQILGIGQNAHIGFNEPGPAFIPATHVVKLTKSTREANQRFFNKAEEVPHEAITMGIKEILAAKKILLLASGEAKAEAVYRMLNGQVDPAVPASILQLHPDVTVLLDEDAALDL